MLRFLLSIPLVHAAIQCLDELGKPTDSWTILKAPQTGDNYLYASAKEDLYQPTTSLNDTTRGALATTLQQLWAEGTSYVLFNDEPPQSSTYNFTVGHTKGILATDETTGFYIIHSLPKFPTGPGQASSYRGLSSNTWTYAQNLYCASFPLQALDNAAYAFQLNLPLIYDSFLTTAVALAAPNISALAKGKSSSAPICAYHSFTTLGGAPHILFAKSSQWNKDLWSSCVAPVLKEDLVVESWIRGSAIGPSCTSSYTVLDAQDISFNTVFTWNEYNDNHTRVYGSTPFHYSSEMDHSKWASSSDGSITCHGDINRMTTQFTRGGGALCFSSFYNLASAVSKENSC